MELLFLIVLTVVLIGVVLASIITPRRVEVAAEPVTMRAFVRDTDGAFVIELQRGDRTVETTIPPATIVTTHIYGLPYDMLEAATRETREALERLQEEPS